MNVSRMFLVALAVVAVGAAACKKEEKPVVAEPAPAVEPAVEAPAAVTETAAPAEVTPVAAPAEATPAAPTAEANPALKDPAQAIAQAPATFKAKFDTTKGAFVVLVNREWAPRGADRFYNLVKIGYFQDIAVFRVVSGFMAQFGIHGDPAVSAIWRDSIIQDDPVKQSNKRGRLTFATRGPNSRSNQFFINLVDNANLDGMGFSPVGEVVEGLDIVDGLYSGYGEGAPQGNGPDQMRVQMEGNAYMKKDFPQLDYIKTITIL